jgi:moderate conductance mechanosensitive channel
MPRTRLYLVLAILLVIAPGTIARSEPAASPPPANTTALTPDQAKRALDLLQDDAKRTQMIDALRAIAAVPAAAPAAAAAAAAPAAAEPQQAAPLLSDGLGVQLLQQISEQLGDLSHEFADAVTTITHFPLLWAWLQDTLTDPFAVHTLLEIVWKLALVLGCALAVEWLLVRIVRRPLKMLAARAPARRIQAETAVELEFSPAAPPVENEARRRHIDFARATRAILRLPFVIAGLALELLPVLGFAATGTMLLGTHLGTESIPRLVILAIVNAYALCRVIMCITRMLVAPGPLGLLNVDGETAAYIEIWVRRIVTVGVFGIALANVALLLGLYRAGYAALVRLVMLVVHLLVVVVILQCRRPVANAIRTTSGTGFLAALRNRVAGVWHYAAAAVVMALWAVWALRVRDGYALLLQYFIGTVAVALVTRLVSIVVLGALDRIFRINPEFLSRFPGLEISANRYLPMLRKAVSAIILAVGFVALLEVWGVNAIVWFYGSEIGGRLVSAALTIAIAAIAAVAIWEISNALMDRHLSRLTREAQYARAARLRTFQPMLRTTLFCVIITVVGLTTLSEIGVNVAPLLAGAGILGIAIGFGSQKLVQDVITGLFLLLENAVQVGDAVTVSGLSGTVENLSIRTIRLRAGDGAVHIVPFSAVTSVTNTSRGIGNAAVAVNIASKEDVDRACDVLKEIAAEMRRDADYKYLIRADLDLWGVDKFDGSMTSIAGQIQCTDSGRWPVQREFNRRLKARFHERGIEIAGTGQTILVQVPAFTDNETKPETRRRSLAS